MYEYKCDNCGNVQEEIHSMKDSPEIKCAKCQTIMHRTITGGTGFNFKGGAPSADLHFKESMKAKGEKQRQKAQAHVKPITSISQL